MFITFEYTSAPNIFTIATAILSPLNICSDVQKSDICSKAVEKSCKTIFKPNPLMNSFTLLSSKQKKLYTVILLLSLAALVITGFLIWLHFKPAEQGSFCNISDYWNCDRINQSTFAELFGIPMAFLGFGFYAFLSLLIIAILKNYPFSNWTGFITGKWFFGLTVLFAILASLFLISQEAPYLRQLIVWGVLRNVLFAAGFLWIFVKFRNNNDLRTRFTAWLAVLTLFGVNFSLYLTDIELFVLKGICIFCLAQQVLIIIIAALNLYELKQLQNGSSATTSQS